MFIDYFTLFSLPRSYRIDNEQLKMRFYELQQKIHPDNFVNASPQEKRLSLEYAVYVNEGYKTLNDPLLRAIYLLQLSGVDTSSETDTTIPVDFLEEQMELREKLSEMQNLPLLKEKILAALNDSEKQIGDLLESSEDKFNDIRLTVRKMQFYANLREEITDLIRFK